MEDRIGELAGDVWDHLQDAGEESISAVSRALDAPQTKVNMALGWLAREGKLEFVAKGRGTAVRSNE